MKKICFISFFMFSIFFAQENLPVANAVIPENSVVDEQQKGSYTILGTVIDQFSREPIGNAKITVLGTSSIAKTSASGQYSISTDDEGIYQLKAEAEGYESQILNNVFFKEGKNSGGFFTLQKVSQEPPPDFVPVERHPQPISGKNPAPLYPEEAKKQKLEGTVWIKIWVDKKGNAHKAVVLKSDAEIFNQPSIDAALKWKFEPAMVKGKPIDVWVSIPFKYKLQPDLKSENPKELLVTTDPITIVFDRARKNKMHGTIWVEGTEDKNGIIIKAFVRRLSIKSDEQKFESANMSDEQKKKISAELYSTLEEMKKIAVKRVMNQKSLRLHKKYDMPFGLRVLIPVEFGL